MHVSILESHVQKTGVGVCCGTFGELLQGIDADNKDFLVTFPINRYSKVLFSRFDHDLIVYPGNKTKSGRLAAMILDFFDKPLQGLIEVTSELPEGKGLASSSADLVATARAIQDYYQLPLTDELLERFLGAIEPTDGVMYDGIVSFYHKEVRLNKRLGTIPSLTILAIDEGGEVDTIEFNKNKKTISRENKERYTHLLSEMEEAVRTQNLERIGEVSTQSAIYNQAYLKKKYLDAMLAINQKIEGLGVIVAHSGTNIGILLFPAEEQYEQKLYQAHSLMKQLGEPMIFHSMGTEE